MPEVAPSTSQGCVLAAVQLSVPPPLLEIVMACEAGFAPPAVPLKLRVADEAVPVVIESWAIVPVKGS